MVRQSIIIGGHKFIVDIYKANIDSEANYSTEFCMLRSYDIKNKIVYDKDLYVIEKAKLNNYFNGSEEVIFPVHNSKFISFSKDPESFSPSLSSINFSDINSAEIYDFYDCDGNIISIKCDKVRIYHPHTLTNLDAIIHVSNYLNSIDVHYLVVLLNSGTIGYVNEFKVDNNIYSEYVDFWMPSPEVLISKDVFFADNLNASNITSNDDDLYNEITSSLVVTLSDGTQLVSTYLLQMPFVLSEYSGYSISNSSEVSSSSDDEDILLASDSDDLIETEDEEYNILVMEASDKKTFYMKTYMPEMQYVIKSNIITYPVILMIYPYSEYSDIIKMYIEDDNLVSNSDMFTVDTRIRLSSTLGFDENGNIALINTFKYPHQDMFDSFKDAYQYYYGMDLSEYDNIIDDSDEDEEPIKQCGFKLMIFSDAICKNMIYDAYYELDDPKNELDDFLFSLNNIFSSWDNFPQYCICVARFIDKYLGITIDGNPKMITKEKFKYLINNLDIGRVTISGEQDDILTINDMDLSKFNFLNNINCTINRTESTPSTATKNSNLKVIYKPIFFRAYDLQTIYIKNSLVQNIGINVGDYMTKVETFKVKIDGNTIIESSRNDVYVIFQIDASILENSSGEYHLINQDDEYISSGKYIVN